MRGVCNTVDDGPVEQWIDYARNDLSPQFFRLYKRIVLRQFAGQQLAKVRSGAVRSSGLRSAWNANANTAMSIHDVLVQRPVGKSITSGQSPWQLARSASRICHAIAGTDSY